MYFKVLAPNARVSDLSARCLASLDQMRQLFPSTSSAKRKNRTTPQLDKRHRDDLRVKDCFKVKLVLLAEKVNRVPAIAVIRAWDDLGFKSKSRFNTCMPPDR